MKILLCGEAWGAEEEDAGLPFVGAAGKVLNSLLAQAGIDRRECHVTNVFNLRPKPSNDIKNLCGAKADGIPGYPSLGGGKYVRAEFVGELQRLYREIEQVRPNVIVALGATAAWAFLKSQGIKQIRGAPAESPYGKVLPTYHPSYLMRGAWGDRPVVLADLTKAKREAEFPEVRRPRREVWVEPSIEDLDFYYRKYIMPSSEISIDIETVGPMITCIGFAPRIDSALVIPFLDPYKPDGNYWATFEEEHYAWEFVRRVCAEPRKIVFQNGLYDMHFLWRANGITVPHATDDTMLLHHALQPEMEKGLAFLGSIYTDEARWKLERRTQTIKRED